MRNSHVGSRGCGRPFCEDLVHGRSRATSQPQRHPTKEGTKRNQSTSAKAEAKKKGFSKGRSSATSPPRQTRFRLQPAREWESWQFSPRSETTRQLQSSTQPKSPSTGTPHVGTCRVDEELWRSDRNGSSKARASTSKVQVHQNHFHQKKFFIKMPLSSKCHFHQKPFSSKTIFIKNQFHQKPISSETTFIKNHFHQKPISSKTNFIRALPVRRDPPPEQKQLVRVCAQGLGL